MILSTRYGVPWHSRPYPHPRHPSTSNNEQKQRWNCGDWRRPRAVGSARTLTPTATLASLASTSILSPATATLALRDVSNPFSLLPLRVRVLPLQQRVVVVAHRGVKRGPKCSWRGFGNRSCGSCSTSCTTCEGNLSWLGSRNSDN